MAGKKTVPLTPEMYREFLDCMDRGGIGFRPNPQIKYAMVLESNLGIRIVDILKLKLGDIVYAEGKHRLDITEQKTGKKRTFAVSPAVYAYMEQYCRENGIGKDEIMVKVGQRTINQYIGAIADYLGYERIGTHSFRKFYSVQMYKNNGNDPVLVQHLLQHSSLATTLTYLDVTDEKIEKAIEGHVFLPGMTMSDEKDGRNKT